MDSCLSALFTKMMTPLERKEIRNMSTHNSDDKLKSKMSNLRIWVISDDVITTLLTPSILGRIFNEICQLPPLETRFFSCDPEEVSMFRASMVVGLAKLLSVQVKDQSILSFGCTPLINGQPYFNILFGEKHRDTNLVLDIITLTVVLSSTLIDYRTGGHSSRKCSIKFNIVKGKYPLHDVRAQMLSEIENNASIKKEIDHFLRLIAANM